ncbi:hypothetical protein MYX84_10705 [Acidobacteria bacterium AH-259-O06]|nr:hypothetical protein [Acidobacteria bacterium AH-259-O06]
MRWRASDRYPIISLLLLIVTALQPAEAKAQRLTDTDLEQLALELSEPPGQFDTDNLISNEASYLQVLPQLKEIAEPGQAYLGVGPDQNFTYLVHVRPALAMIVDLRRDNLLEHLYLKELIEVSGNRWQYLSYLFGKPLPTGFRPDPAADASVLVNHLRSFPSDDDFFEKSFLKIWSSIRHRFPRLTWDQDRVTFYQIALAFFEENFQLRYRSHGRRPRPYYPSYEQLMTETYQPGQMGHYLNSESDFRFLKKMQTENRIIPIVGDLAGPKALKSIGKYLKKQGYVVSTFYVSNVEFYLFRKGQFPHFVASVTELPTNQNSVFIRSYFNYWREHPETVAGYYVTSLLQQIQSFLELHQERPYEDYWDVVTRDYIPTQPPDHRP